MTDITRLQVSAIVIVGSQRIRAQQSITALCNQENANQLELVIVDCETATYSKLETHGDASIVYLTPNGTKTWGQIRAYAVQQSSAPILAFLEEHTKAQKGWLTAIINAFEAHHLSAATYSFISGNSNNYVARSGHIAEYGLWSAPASKISSSFLPWNNFILSRSFLMSLDADLDQLFENDTLIYDHIRRTNANYVQINDAVLAHIGHENLLGLLVGSFYGSQLVAHQRVLAGQWNWARRIVYAFSVPLFVPFMRLRRLFSHYLNTSQPLWRLIEALPIILLLYFTGSVAEGLGYLTFSEKALDGFIHTEIHVKRDHTIDI